MTISPAARARYAHLVDRRPLHPPIAREERDARVARLADLLRSREVDALLIEPTATLAYLSDVRWGTSERLLALVVLASGDVFWIAPAFEVPRLGASVLEHGPAGPIVAWDEHEYPWRPLAHELARRGVRRLAVDPRARAFVVHGLMEVGLEVAPGRELVRLLRARKDPHELALLRAANEITKEAIELVAAELEPGTTDVELGQRVRAAQEALGLTDTWVLPLYAEDAADPHGEPLGRPLCTGDTVLVDTGGALFGYQSDVTRTWVFGAAPSVDQRRVWDTVRAAQRAAFEALVPGAPCSMADRAARAVIEQAGYGEGYSAFAHRLGHGIGLEGHEEPCLDGGCEVLLEPGMTFSNEPGIYLRGEIGLRIEDIVAITDTGAEVLGGSQLGPESPRSG